MSWSDWANLLLRWLHLFSGILWIGQTWLFMWLDRHLEDALENPGGQLYMVHSGGFYVVEKRPAPRRRCRRRSTGSSGRRRSPGRPASRCSWSSTTWAACCRSPTPSCRRAPRSASASRCCPWPGSSTTRCGASCPRRVAAPVSFALIVGLAWALGHVFSARAAYMHVGAALGTIMAANVWERILPAQRAMVEAIRAGRPPDLTLGARAKERSKHNTFIVVPLVMIMLSSHFPTLTFAHDQAWAMLGLLTLVGWAAAWLVRRH